MLYTHDNGPKYTEADYAKLRQGRIVRSAFPNKQIREYSTRHVFVTGNIDLTWVRGKGFGGGYGGYDPFIEAIDPFLEKLALVDGIIEFSVHISSSMNGPGPYGIRVQIAPSFDWDEIEPTVFKLLIERDKTYGTSV